MTKPEILRIYQTTLTDSEFYDPDVREYADPKEQIQEFIRDYALSYCEINWCRKISLKQYTDHPAYDKKKELHIAMCIYYKTLTEGEEESLK